MAYSEYFLTGYEKHSVGKKTTKTPKPEQKYRTQIFTLLYLLYVCT